MTICPNCGTETSEYDTTYKVGGWKGLICGGCDYRIYDGDSLEGVSTTDITLTHSEADAAVLSGALLLAASGSPDDVALVLVDTSIRMTQALARMRSARINQEIIERAGG